MMARWQFPDASAEVERLRVELEQARKDLDAKGAQLAIFEARRAGAVSDRQWWVDLVDVLIGKLKEEDARADRLQAERDDLATRLQSIQQSERKYTAAKLTEAAKMRKGQAT